MPKKRWPILQASHGRVLFHPAIIEDQSQGIVASFLKALGFRQLSLDPTLAIQYFAKTLLGGKSVYYRNAEPKDAPGIVNCSTAIQWCYGQIGVRVPTLAIQQYLAGEPINDFFTIKIGDLLFKRGSRNYWDYDNPGRRIGHVGIVADVDSKDGVVIHATQKSGGVAQTTIDDFIKRTGLFVGACRIVQNLKDWQVLDIPPQLQWRIKSSDDVKWLFLESISDT